MASQFATDATAIYVAEHPEEANDPPPASGLDVIASKGGTTTQASNTAFAFIKKAIFPDGTVYQTGYNAWTLDHNAGEVDGFGYGLTPAEFEAQYQTPAAPFDPTKAPPGYVAKNGQWVLEFPGPPDPLPGYTCPTGEVMDGKARCWPIPDRPAPPPDGASQAAQRIARLEAQVALLIKKVGP